MAGRSLELTLISAHNLKSVNRFSKMEVYAESWLATSPWPRHRIPADPIGGRNPTWNRTLSFPLPPAADAPLGRAAALHIQLRTRRDSGFDREVGEVRVPLRDMLDFTGDAPVPITLSVRRPSAGRSMGVIYLSYKIGRPIAAAPAAAPPAPAVRVVGDYARITWLARAHAAAAAA